MTVPSAWLCPWPPAFGLVCSADAAIDFGAPPGLKIGALLKRINHNHFAREQLCMLGIRQLNQYVLIVVDRERL